MTHPGEPGKTAGSPVAAGETDPPQPAATEPRHISVVLAAYLLELRERAG